MEVVNAEEFIAIKGVKAKGKRLTTLIVAEIKEIAPLVPDEEIPEIRDETIDSLDFDPDQDNGGDIDPPQMTLEM